MPFHVLQAVRDIRIIVYIIKKIKTVISCVSFYYLAHTWACVLTLILTVKQHGFWKEDERYPAGGRSELNPDQTAGPPAGGRSA